MTDINGLKIGFIGAGRLGKALAWHCSRSGLNVAAVASLLPEESDALASNISGCSVRSAQEVAEMCDLIFVTTPDGVIKQTADGINWRQDSFVVHCSGATEVDHLSKAQADGAYIGGFHPLQTFGDPEAAAKSLPGCTITVEANEPLDDVLVELAKRLRCSVNRLPAGARPLYHAAAGYTSQFMNVLMREASLMWQSWGGTEEGAVKALMPLVRGTIASIEEAGVARGMPGPVSRGDVASVAKHVQAVEEFDRGKLALYREMCGRTVSIALELGRIDEATASQFMSLLEGDVPAYKKAATR
jgi:predicted short-subunit dehydrogenase-like oxidoreductase (DUF2520 family)